MREDEMQFCQNSQFLNFNRKDSFNHEFNNKNFYDSNAKFDKYNLNMTNSDCKKQMSSNKKSTVGASQKSDEVFHKINLEKVKINI
jgi:hypothetical protein